ncbi:Golgi-specific brefeldin A-resistance guanine nucleotide exchange factor 1 isoform X1 [Carassius auratus]|uniref:Golgi-specific brefeldin A-resistance guanine nucleotide exchange factor 1 n=1 Tax=Carassius auratus TaxID=7957 RepID=A0A6P6L8Z6_CARAU|nr:Golgi-specific brefeldin A-resistance guanine nucleotide exchange factor 1-like isoform X1 [Carassius auratus]XP_026080193.1 Golgi-specific brefeldin A-resistance guanine nucleotide exchange factor 1-like isoform X1 [Carassius auratus]
MVDKNIYIVQGEISVVVAAIKRNSRWSTHTPLDEEQDPLLNSFSHLKETLNNIKDLSDVEPNVFLRPFLEVVRSEDTTGPITGLALTSVNKFLSYGLIDANHEGAAEGIENMADAVTHARFVGTDPASDEVVLMKILQVLRSLLLTPVGAHLTNESVCEIMQSCFRICFEMRLSELLRKSAEHTLVDMVQLLFSRLPQFKEEAKSFVGTNMKKAYNILWKNKRVQLKMRAGGMSESSKWKKQKRSPRPPRHMVRSPSGQMDPGQSSTLTNNLSGGVPFIEQHSGASSTFPGSDSAVSSISSPTADSGLDTGSKTTSKEDLTDLEQSSSTATTPMTPSAEPGRLESQSEGREVERAQSASVESIPEVLEDRDLLADQSDSASVHDMDYVNPRGVRFTQSTQKEGAALIPYGLPCLRELFRFLISLTNPHDRHNSDVMLHMGLQLLNVALEAAHIAPYQSLLCLVKDELCRHLTQLLSVDRMNLYAASIRVCFLLFESMREHLKFQLEMYLKKLMDIITSENPKMPYEMKEMALEAIVQLWRIPSFVTELYINYDSDFYCSNLFEDLTKLLSKNAFPVSGQLYTTHLLSLEALLTVIDSTEAHCQAKVLNSAAQQDQSESMTVEGDTSVNTITDSTTEAGKSAASSNGQNAVVSDTWTACPPTSGHLMAEKMRLGRQDLEETDTEKKSLKKPHRFTSCLPDSQELLEIKNKKKLLITGTEQFNQKPKKGIQILQEKGLLSSPMDNNEVAQWLRENPRLDKKMIGEFISDRRNTDLLDSFVNTFTFQGLRIDEALRLYLEAFRLPGEAPVIHRLLETFTDNWQKVNGNPFQSNDAGFALAYAVIMLNTDQHNHNVRKQNIPMTLEQFKKNLKGVNGGNDFDQDMLEDIYNAIKNEEIVMPDEQTGLVKENYVWSVLLHRGASSEGMFLHVPESSYDRDLFTMTWGPTIAALSYVFDKSLDDAIIQKAIAGFRKCAMISAHYGFSDVFDNLIISLCKFTTLSSESVENLPTVFGSNRKAQIAAKTVFSLAHRHGDILREGWKNIMDSMLQLFRAELLPKSMVEVEDFVDPNEKISLQREETPSNRGESAVLSFVSWLTLSEQPGLRGPSTENQEAKQAALLCIKHCDPEKLITESKFLQLESLQELMKALISVTPDEETYDEEDAAFCLEMLLRIILENRDRVSCVWQTVRDHLYQLCVHASESCFLVERAVVGLLRLAIRLLRREDIGSQVLLSLRLLLMMKPHVLSRVCREVAFGLHELLKTNAANIHCTDDWYTLFSLLECIGAGVKPPAALQVANTHPDNDTGAQSDSELSSYHQSEISLDRGYTSDSEVYTEHGKSRIPRSATDVDVGWLVVGKDDLDGSKAAVTPGSKPMTYPLINQYSLTLGQDTGLHDTKSLIKCVDSLSFIVRDAAHVTPENFELCVKAMRVFVEASLNGGYRTHEKKKSHKYDSKSSRLRKKPREKEGTSRRTKASSQRPTRSQSDDEEDEGVPASYHTVSFQVSLDLLDLMHTLHTRAAGIYSSWAEEQRHLEDAGRKIEADSQTLWSSCWCPLLQGMAWLCCDARRQVRMQALTYLQRALLVHDLQTLDAVEWESCFNKVLFPLLTKLLDNISPADVGGMEETRMRACTLLSKVFLQHLSPLLSLPTFAALWLTILDFMDKYMHAGSSDLLLEAIPESLKNMLLVMDTAGIFHSADSRTGYSDLWEITWERIDCFLPHLKEELFKQAVISEPVCNHPVEPVPPPAAVTPASPPVPAPSPVPAAPAEPNIPSRPESPQDTPTPSANGDRSDRSSPVPPSTPPMPTPAKMSPPESLRSPLGQSPLILQPLASPLQVGVPPMSLPIILNPALIEATSPVPLLPRPNTD